MRKFLIILVVLFDLQSSLSKKSRDPSESCPGYCPRNSSSIIITPCYHTVQHINLNTPHSRLIRELIVFGHNGLRNRLAQRLKSCDMISMYWDRQLAEVANCYHCGCIVYEQIPHKMKLNDLSLFMAPGVSQTEVPGKNITKVVWNSFLWRNYQMHNFIQRAVNHWYKDHMFLDPPKLVPLLGELYYELFNKKKNQFVHLISPVTYRVGCSLAKLSAGLSLMCYYLPFFENNPIYFRLRPSEYQCPFNFPVRDESFSNLCKYAEYH